MKEIIIKNEEKLNIIKNPKIDQLYKPEEVKQLA